jgi:hypothetical protein
MEVCLWSQETSQDTSFKNFHQGNTALEKFFMLLVILAIVVPCLADDEYHPPTNLNRVQPGDVFIQQPGGAINTRTGEFYPKSGPGLVAPETGEYMPRIPGGYINLKTGFNPGTDNN